MGRDPGFWKSPLNSIIMAGLLSGTMDIMTAIILYCLVFQDITVVQLLHHVASGALGMSAFSGGVPTAFLGLFFQYVIAFAFTLFYFLVYPYLSLLSRNWILNGLVYGIFVWLVMIFLVLPLSRTHHQSFDWVNTPIAIAILMVMVGLPIARIAYKHYSARSTAH